MLNSIHALVAASSSVFSQAADFQPQAIWWQVVRYALTPCKPARHSSGRMMKRDDEGRYKKHSYKGKK